MTSTFSSDDVKNLEPFLPAVGLGTWPMSDAEAEIAVAQALTIGYRLVDTAASYGNEVGVGRGVARSGVCRDDVVVMTKLRGRDHGYRETHDAVRASLGRLGLDYLDVYLIHWPLPRIDRYVQSWQAMIELQQAGLIRSIGVSNFLAEHIERLRVETGVIPAVNQIEVHPQFPNQDWRRYNDDHDIRTVAYTPIGRGSGVLDAPVIADIAAQHGRSPAQVTLRWHRQLGTVPVPKAASPDRQRENLATDDFELTADEMSRIAALADSAQVGFSPLTHEEF